jgi:hypothetical protein
VVFLVEEQKYLRQVYKKQLTSETITEKDEADRAPLARLFRGVANDKDRRGELFGYSNLLRFQEGTLNRYTNEPEDTQKFGVGVHTDSAILNSLESLGEEGVMSLFDEQEVVVKDIAYRKAEGEFLVFVVDQFLHRC